jgi:O-antigen ligase
MNKVEPAGSTFFYSFLVFLLLAPLYKGGNRVLPLLLLEIAAVGFIFVVAGVQRAPLALPRTLLAAIAILLVYPLIQLLPLPDALWRVLPGHAEYAVVLERFATDGMSSVRRAISIVPGATEFGWLALLPPLACLLAVLRLQPDHVRLLLLSMVIFAGGEALLGLLQVGLGGDSIFYLRNDQAYGTAVGTFVNRNHLAGMLGMTLPVAVGWIAYSIRHGRHQRKGGAPRSPVTETLSQRLLVFALAVLILLCLFFTRSRAGMATAFVGLACSSIVLTRMRTGAKSARLVVPSLIAVGIVLAVAIGIAPILERFEPRELTLSEGGRGGLFMATARAAIDFLPFGSGLSTFAEVFPRYQVMNLGGIAQYAHNDYLQAFMELGLAAPVIVALMLGAYAKRIVELLRAEGSRSFALLQLGAGMGMLPTILHSMFDFALHIPADAMWFATLAGVLFHEGVDPRARIDGERRGRHPGDAPEFAP